MFIKEEMKKNINIILFVFFFMGLSIFMLTNFIKNDRRLGERCSVLRNSDMYLLIEEEKITYYRISEKSKNLYCEDITIDGNSYLCYLYFEKNEEPLTGWISKDSLSCAKSKGNHE